MRILQLCNKPPQPKVDGGCIAMSNISEGLIKAGHELDILTISTDKHPFQLDAFSALIKSNTKLDHVHIDTRVNIVDAFSALISSDSYNVSRFFSSDFDFKLIKWLSDKSYDVIHLESIFMTPYIPSIRKLSQAKLVLRSHNLEHIIWERLANVAMRSPKKIYLKHLASRLKKYELNIMNQVDAIASISEMDTVKFQSFKCKSPIKTIPFGIDIENFIPVIPKFEGKLKLFHIGAMDWTPNTEAVHYLIDEIWPDVKNKNLELNLAGKAMSAYFKNLDIVNITVHGEVKSAQKFMADNHVMVVPLLSGSGVRVKIIEGMAMGKVIITTSIGAEGIDATPGKHFLIANSPAEFKKHIDHLLTNPNLLNEIGKNARDLVELHYDNHKIIEELVRFYAHEKSSSVN